MLPNKYQSWHEKASYNIIEYSVLQPHHIHDEFRLITTLNVYNEICTADGAPAAKSTQLVIETNHRTITVRLINQRRSRVTRLKTDKNSYEQYQLQKNAIILMAR